MYTAPHPPPFRWLKRLSCALLLLLTILLILRLLAGHLANRRLATLLEQYRRAGQPLLPSDFESPPIPASENAALLLRDAAEDLRLTREQAEIVYDGSRPPPEQMPQVASAVAANRSALEKVRQARALRKANWGIQRTSKAMIPPNVHDELISQRRMVDLLRSAAFYAHQSGDEVAAAEFLRDILFIARTLDQMPRNSTNRVAADVIIELAPEWSMPSPLVPGPLPNGGCKAWPISPGIQESTQSLIRELLDEESRKRNLQQLLLLSRAECLKQSGTAGSERLYTNWSWSKPSIPIVALDAIAHFAVRPVITSGYLNWAEDLTRAIDAAGQPTWHAADAIDKASPERPLNAHWHWLFDISLPSPQLAIEKYFTELTDRRAAALLLAMRLYQLDHDGRLPATLDVLVPTYLPAIPLDPFSPSGHPLRYRFDNYRVCVYSVGTDEIDNGAGDESATPRNPMSAMLRPGVLCGMGFTRQLPASFRALWGVDGLDAVYPLVPGAAPGSPSPTDPLGPPEVDPRFNNPLLPTYVSPGIPGGSPAMQNTPAEDSAPQQP